MSPVPADPAAGGFLVFLLLLVLLGAVAVGVAWLLVAKRRSREASGAGGCGACGYSVRGLESWQCPECGADLKQVGVRPADGPARHNWLWTIVLAIIFVAFVLMCASSLLFTAQPVTP